MGYSEYISIIAIIISVVTAGFAVFSYFSSVKREKRRLTIDAFYNFQKDVLDKLVLCSKKDIIETVENRDDEPFNDLYKAYCVQTARCEHFAVGINEDVFDYELFNKLGGLHVMYLYEKLEPIIIETRKSAKNSIPYSEFEKLYKRLVESNK